MTKLNQKENIDQQLEKINNVKFNRTPKEKLDFNSLGELTSFLNFHKGLIKFVDWTQNIIYLRTDVEQPLYVTDEDNYSNTYNDRVGFFLTQD